MHGERQILYRIAILLFPLAGLAEFAAGGTAHQRRCALLFIRQGEFAALGLLMDLLQRPMLTHDAYWDEVLSDEPEDAMLLAGRLLILAFMLAMMAALPESDESRRRGDPGCIQPCAGPPMPSLAHEAPPYRDTS